MTITVAHETDVLDWPAYGITMTREQAERLGAEGIELPDDEPHVYTEEEASMGGLVLVPYSAILQRMYFHHRGRQPATNCDLELSE